ncbi:MAG: hypothetical protein GY869_27255 [Planctomycetes bacterium]|nr:hypothetical protein [Planctomycetota bacterium]
MKSPTQKHAEHVATSKICRSCMTRIAVDVYRGFPICGRCLNPELPPLELATHRGSALGWESVNYGAMTPFELGWTRKKRNKKGQFEKS